MRLLAGNASRRWRPWREPGFPPAFRFLRSFPGLNDEDVPDLLARARQAGAVEAMATLLRLSGPVEPVFMERMAAAFPDRVTKMTNRIQEVRGGAIAREPSLNATVAPAPTGP